MTCRQPPSEREVYLHHPHDSSNDTASANLVGIAIANGLSVTHGFVIQRYQVDSLGVPSIALAVIADAHDPGRQLFPWTVNTPRRT